MQYKNYLPYTYIHGEPTTRTQRAFSFSLKEEEEEEKKRPKEKKKKPNSSEHFGTKKCHLQLLVTCLGSEETESCKSHQCARTSVPPPTS